MKLDFNLECYSKNFIIIWLNIFIILNLNIIDIFMIEFLKIKWFIIILKIVIISFKKIFYKLKIYRIC
jgi:hypothetical protein